MLRRFVDQGCEPLRSADRLGPYRHSYSYSYPDPYPHVDFDHHIHVLDVCLRR